MGVVYKAHDRELDCTVALKMIREDQAHNPETLARFRRELRLGQQVTHENVCRLYDLGEVEGVPYLSMEFLQGHTLAALIGEMGGLSPRQTFDIANDVCAGLEAIHGEHIVHRDLKPSNVAVTTAGRTVVLDLGIARRSLDLDVTEPGVVVGSYAYIAPEQVEAGPIDQRTDIYALGLLLFEMLTGRRAPGDGGAPLALRGRDFVCPPPSDWHPGLSPELDELISSCVAWEPERRPESVASVREALVKCREHGGVRPADPKPGFRNWRRLAVVGAVIGTLFLIAPWIIGAVEDWTRGPAKQSVAVLPFEYEGDASREYLAPLYTESLIAGLQTDPDLAVAPFETVQYATQIGGFTSGLSSKLGRELAVQSLVRGKVSARDAELSVWVELSSLGGEILWASTLTGLVNRPLPTVERVRLSIAAQLGAAAGAGKPVTQIRSPNAAAYQKYLEGLDLYGRGFEEEDLAKAGRLLRETVETDPDFVAAHAALARVLVTRFYQSDEPSLIAEAAEVVRRAQALEPELPEVLVAAGFLEEARGATVEAEQYLQQAIRLSPGNDVALRILADFYGDLGRHDEAIDAFQRAVELRPGDWRGHYARGSYTMMMLGDLDSAEVDMEKAEELNRSAAAPKLRLGSIQLSRGRLDDAEAWFRRALEISSHPMAHSQLGFTYYHQLKFDQALTRFQMAAELAPERPWFRLWQGHSLRQLGEAGLAREAYMDARRRYMGLLAQRPNDPVYRADFAAVLASLDECERANNEIHRALDANPDSAELSTIATYAALRCGSEDEAVRHALEAIELGDLLVRYNPDLEPLLQIPEIRVALERAGAPLP